MTRNPFRAAASAAAHPPVPPPITATSQPSSRAAERFLEKRNTPAGRDRKSRRERIRPRLSDCASTSSAEFLKRALQVCVFDRETQSRLGEPSRLRAPAAK